MCVADYPCLIIFMFRIKISDISSAHGTVLNNLPTCNLFNMFQNVLNVSQLFNSFRFNSGNKPYRLDRSSVPSLDKTTYHLILMCSCNIFINQCLFSVIKIDKTLFLTGKPKSLSLTKSEQDKEAIIQSSRQNSITKRSSNEYQSMI